MKKKALRLILCSLGLAVVSPAVFAADLLEVFQQALHNDPAFQAAVAQIQSQKQGVPIALSYLLPQLSGTAYEQKNWLNNRTGTKIPGTHLEFGVGNYDFSTAYYQVSLQQSVFDYALWAGLSQQKYLSKAADADYTAALQDLMTRTATAYFNVLSAEDQLRYTEAEKKAVAQQLDQARQQYKVGVIAITNVYQAQAQYDTLLSEEISDQNDVINQRENLRAITNVYYSDLAGLKDQLPLIMPVPANPDKWVETAVMQNWALISQRYNVEAAHSAINVQRAGHLPTVTGYASNTGQRQGVGPGGQVDSTNNAVGIQLDLPIFQGGLVNAETKQASYNYQNAVAQMQQTYRGVVDNTHTSYNNVVSGISQVRADQQSILSNASSLRSTIEGYRVGAQTMLDVLQAQQNLYQAEQQYSTDEYSYINATIALKQAAGTLSLTDLQLINTWLTPKHESYSSLNIESIQRQAEQNYQASVKANKELGITPPKSGNIVKEVNKMDLSIDGDVPTVPAPPIPSTNTSTSLPTVAPQTSMPASTDSSNGE